MPLDYSLLKQGTQNNCGAFCLEYLKLLKQGIISVAPDISAIPQSSIRRSDAQSAVDNYYSVIQFGKDFPPVKADYCDPVKMMDVIQGLGYHSTFYYEPKSTIEQILSALTGLSYYAPPQLANTVANPLPVLQDGDYQIAIYAVQGELHYVLWTQENRYSYMYNPWNGAPIIPADFRSPGQGLVYAGGGIHIA
jgi:hypothetical protein